MKNIIINGSGIIKTKVILVFSGGLDSTTLLYWLLNNNYEVKCLTFDYGQKARKEIEYAKKTCDKLKIEYEIRDIQEIMSLLSSSSIVDKDKENMIDPSETVVPSRNTILLSLATAKAITDNYAQVYYGAQKSDTIDYPDCTPEFLSQMNELNKVNNYKYIPILAPFINYDKKKIVGIARELDVPLEDTWSCYNNSNVPCGTCFSCKSRIKAIEEVNNVRT